MVQISDVTVYDVHAGNDFKKKVSPNENVVSLQFILMRFFFLGCTV